MNMQARKVVVGLFSILGACELEKDDTVFGGEPPESFLAAPDASKGEPIVVPTGCDLDSYPEIDLTPVEVVEVSASNSQLKVSYAFTKSGDNIIELHVGLCPSPDDPTTLDVVGWSERPGPYREVDGGTTYLFNVDTSALGLASGDTITFRGAYSRISVSADIP